MLAINGSPLTDAATWHSQPWAKARWLGVLARSTRLRANVPERCQRRNSHSRHPAWSSWAGRDARAGSSWLRLASSGSSIHGPRAGMNPRVVIRFVRLPDRACRLDSDDDMPTTLPIWPASLISFVVATIELSVDRSWLIWLRSGHVVATFRPLGPRSAAYVVATGLAHISSSSGTPFGASISSSTSWAGVREEKLPIACCSRAMLEPL